MKKVQIICVCGYGLGSSLVLKMQLDDVMKEAGIDAEISPEDITSAVGTKVDIIFTSEEFLDQLKASNSIPVIAISDYLNKALLREVAVPAVKKIIGE